MEPEGSLPHSQEHAICPCRRPDASSEGPSILYIYIFNPFHFYIIVPIYANVSRGIVTSVNWKANGRTDGRTKLLITCTDTSRSRHSAGQRVCDTNSCSECRSVSSRGALRSWCVCGGAVRCVVGACCAWSKVRCLDEVLCAKCCTNSVERAKQEEGGFFLVFVLEIPSCLGFTAKGVFVLTKPCSKFSQPTCPWLPGT